MTRTETLRNLSIVLLLAALVDLLPGGGTAASAVMQALSLAFLALLVWIAARLYREHRDTVYTLGSRRRAILYAAAGVATLTFTATHRLWSSAGGSVAWLVLIAACAYAVYGVYRSYRQY